ncbi:hypothetical protein OsJ_15738 [Oryza sativa Japonica Group]|uniref:Glycosyltransferase N-terminal domain-containing protein n=1 Tax=Oryza sativa subsp. japonica TaxID=39947 RepID=A3AWA8_ORYSJ|nr:hypothetical protein OsJ_15738 [Oryza sativa Japonica Group]
MAIGTVESVAVVAVPFPAQGHLNQLMHLSLLLASRGLDVHYAAPPAHLRQARLPLHGWDPDALRSIRFHDLDVPAYESPPPDPTAPALPARRGTSAWTGSTRQPLASVLYVSFGTTSSLRGDQVAELAAALKGSKQRFIWVLRDADRANIFADSGESRHAELLSRFTAETEGVGLVITGWAPQLEILAHGATAAFMSHCGWNSTMESLSYGKPILAWPMHSDQPWDAELVCKYLKAGLLVRPWEKHSEVVPAEAIQEVIEEAMLPEKGMTIRRRAKELGEAVRASVADGGSSRKGLDDFVGYITR